MKYFYTTIYFLFTYCIFLTIDYFYHHIYNDSQMIKHQFLDLKIIFFIQFILSLITAILKHYYAPLASLFYYIATFIPLFCYKDDFKNKIKNYLIVVILCMIVELSLTPLMLFLANTIFGYNITVVDDIFKTHILLSSINLLLVAVNDYFIFKLTLKLRQMIDPKNMTKLFLVCFLPVLLLGVNINLLYTATKDTFMIFSLIYWSIFLIIVILLYKNIKHYKKEKNNNLINQKYEQAIYLQTKEMESIDQYYKNIRKANHDFQNHCIIISTLFKNKDKSVKQYLQSLLDRSEKNV